MPNPLLPLLFPTTKQVSLFVTGNAFLLHCKHFKSKSISSNHCLGGLPAELKAEGCAEPWHSASSVGG